MRWCGSRAIDTVQPRWEVVEAPAQRECVRSNLEHVLYVVRWCAERVNRQTAEAGAGMSMSVAGRHCRLFEQ